MASAPPAGPRFEWYQTPTDVVISIFIRNVKEDQLTVEVHERSATVTVKLATGTDVVVDFDPLLFEVLPSASTHRAIAPKIELTLKKKNVGVSWAKLEGDDVVPLAASTSAIPADVINPPSTGPSYPTSSRNKVNWDKLAADAVKEEEEAKSNPADKNAQGGDKQLNELFQKLYAGATDEQRMAMVKSYQESNGTSLSTNWDDVKKGPVETKPPDSMVAVDWSSHSKYPTKKKTKPAATES